MRKMTEWVVAVIIGLAAAYDSAAWLFGFAPTISSIVSNYDVKHPWVRWAAVLAAGLIWLHLFGRNVFRR